MHFPTTRRHDPTAFTFSDFDPDVARVSGHESDVILLEMREFGFAVATHEDSAEGGVREGVVH